MNILAVSPHPDDIEYSISGILLKCRDHIKDLNLTVAYNTKYDLLDSSISETHVIRCNEAQLACKMMKADYMEFSVDDSLDKITAMLKKCAPDILFLPSVDDENAVHRMTTLLIENAVEVMKNTEDVHLIKQLFYYETYSSINFSPDIILDVTEVFAESKKILLCHKNGINVLKILPYKFQVIHQIRGFGCARPYGEGLKLSSASQFKWYDNFKYYISFIQTMMG
ncbi:MAG: PIG-L deacetylase family protein [Mobilitalea sp.]